MIKSLKSLIVAAAAAVLSFGFAPAAHANIVTDGVFADSSNFATNWNPSGGFIGTSTYNSMTAVALGSVGTPGSISQMLSTVAGASYSISFDLAHPNDSSTSMFQAIFNGVTLLNLSPVANNSNYTSYSFNAIATTASTLLQFIEREDPSFMYLTNVAVNQVSNVPLPASVYMMVAALLAFAAYAQNRKKFAA